MLLKISYDQGIVREWCFEVNDDALYRFLVKMGTSFIEVCQPELLELQEQHNKQNFDGVI